MGNTIKQFINHFGLDLKSSDIVREPQFASDMMNAKYRKDGNITKRSGFRSRAESQGGFGLYNYKRIDPATARENEILIAVDENLNKLISSTMTVSYSGADESCIFELFFDTVSSVYRCQITEGTTLILNYDLGKGIDELSPVDLADLKGQIDALTDFSATITGDDTIPAAFLDLARSVNLFGGDLDMTAYSWEQISSPSAVLFPGNNTFKNDTDFENTAFEQINNVAYFSNGYDSQIKYDGQNAYKSGLPQGSSLTGVLNGAGAPNGAYIYAVVYSNIDAVGNLTEGNIGPNSAVLNPANQIVDVTVDNIQEGSGFNTNCAIVAGAQGPVNTITVDDGSGGQHTMRVGDTAYFFDTVSGSYVEREVTTITATTITVAGAAVTVTDNSVISNNLRIGIYRTRNAGTIKYLVAEIPNNSFAAQQVYSDNTADSALGIELIIPEFSRDLPPKGRYLASYNNQMFVSGDLSNPNLAYWTPPGEPEHFYTAILNLRFQSPNGDKIKAIKQSNEVMCVFESRAIHIISGDIPNNNIRVETITKDIGCVSQQSIQEVKGLLYFLSDRGVYTTVSGQLPEELSGTIEPLFERITLSEDEELHLKTAVAVNFRLDEEYILHIPARDYLGSDPFANDFSGLVAQDTHRKAWLLWDKMNMNGGATVYEDALWWTERRNSTELGQVTNYLNRRNDRGDNWDYNDNLDPVSWEYSTAWYHFNEPSIFKKFLWLKMFGTQETDNNLFSLDMEIERDFVRDAVVGNFEIDFADGIEGYGVSPYGVASYGDVTDPNRKVKIGPIKARSIRFRMKNEEMLQNVDITGWELQLAMPFRKEIKE